MTTKLTYKTTGTCSSLIELTAEDDVLTDVCFTGGCHGNLQGISRLVCGMKLDEVRRCLAGIRCGHKPTSCPDQLSQAVAQLEAKIQGR